MNNLILNRIAKARSILLLNQPFFGCLALRLNTKIDNSCDTAWTDGETLAFNEEFIKSLSMPELEGLVAHEVMHLALLHHTRKGNSRKAKKWNVACDFAANQNLSSSGFTLPVGALLNDAFAGLSAEAIYSQLPDGDKLDKSMGDVREPTNKTPAEIKLEEQRWKISISQAVALSKAMGKDPADGFARAVEESLNSKVDWRYVLREFMEKSVCNDYTWLRPNPRYLSQGIYLPGLYSRNVGDIAVVIDTSGSVSESQLGQIEKEITAMLEEFPSASILVVYCDSIVQGSVELSQADLPINLELLGGGGTDFRPAFKFVDTLEKPLSCLVYLTDLACNRYPDKVLDYPVLWVNTCDYGFPDPPFGEVIKMELD
jgi:predicted metal-dependent peptidase